jgi:hypothetical protein
MHIEGKGGALSRGDAPAGEGAGKACLPMIGEKQAGRARGMGGEAQPAGGERRLDLCLRQGRAQGPALESFFQGPGGVIDGSRLDDEEERRVEADGLQARPVGPSPFACGRPG